MFFVRVGFGDGLIVGFFGLVFGFLFIGNFFFMSLFNVINLVDGFFFFLGGGGGEGLWGMGGGGGVLGFGGFFLSILFLVFIFLIICFV